MTLKNRLLATQRSRALMIQAGDMSYSVEAATDLRADRRAAQCAGPFFGALTTTWTNVTAQGGTHAA